APQFDIRMGNRTTVQSVTASSAGQFAVTANNVMDDLVQGSIISNTPAGGVCTFDPNPCGGLKANQAQGIRVNDNKFFGNSDGAPLWFDINPRGSATHPTWSITNNDIHNNGDPANNLSNVNGQTDGIRIEISCEGVITGNTVTTSGDVGIDLVNAS